MTVFKLKEVENRGKERYYCIESTTTGDTKWVSREDVKRMYTRSTNRIEGIKLSTDGKILVNMKPTQVVDGDCGMGTLANKLVTCYNAEVGHKGALVVRYDYDTRDKSIKISTNVRNKVFNNDLNLELQAAINDFKRCGAWVSSNRTYNQLKENLIVRFRVIDESHFKCVYYDDTHLVLVLLPSYGADNNDFMKKFLSTLCDLERKHIEYMKKYCCNAKEYNELDAVYQRVTGKKLSDNVVIKNNTLLKMLVVNTTSATGSWMWIFSGSQQVPKEQQECRMPSRLAINESLSSYLGVKLVSRN